MSDATEKTVACPECGTMFVPNEARGQKYCSNRCASTRITRLTRERKRALRTDLQFVCVGCETTFTKPVTAGRPPLYCSEKCRLKVRSIREYQPPVKRPCMHCGGPIGERNGKTRFCSSVCYRAFVAVGAKWKAKGLDPDNHGLAPECGICGKVKKKMVIDHDHQCCPGERTCGKCTRGMLCHACNVALGMMKDDPAMLRVAADYIERFRTELGTSEGTR